MVERTFVMVKTDGVHRGMIAGTISRLEQRRLKLIALKMLIPTKDLIEAHYQEHAGKDFFDNLVAYSCSGPVVALVVEGENATAVVRTMLGNSDPQDSGAATIRCRSAVSLKRTVVHASDSPTAADREIKLWFEESELNL